MTLTDTQKAIIREYKARWTAPRDWDGRALDSGTSSAILWLEWAISPQFDLERCKRAMDRIPAGTQPPPLKLVRWYYDRQGASDARQGHERPFTPITPREAREMARKAGLL